MNSAEPMEMRVHLGDGVFQNYFCTGVGRGELVESERDRILNDHLGLVHYVARRMSKSLAAEVEFDELVSMGTIGLIQALDTFDASLGLAFSTYAAPRVRGAILDELRRQDHVPRSIRQKTRVINAAREEHQRETARLPSDRELACRLGLAVEALWRWRTEIEGVFHMPIDRPVREDDRRTAPADVIAGATGRETEDALNLEQEVEVLRAAIPQLKEQERVVLTLYYFEQLNLSQIAGILELTESRICQIRSKAIAKLRRVMAPLREQVA